MFPAIFFPGDLEIDICEAYFYRSFSQSNHQDKCSCSRLPDRSNCVVFARMFGAVVNVCKMDNIETG